MQRVDDVQLVANDGRKFAVDCVAASMSTLVKVMLLDSDETDLPLLGVGSRALEKIVMYMKHHVGPPPTIDKPLKSANMAEAVPQWDANFIDVEHDMLFELILASNYMDIQPLLDLSCAKLASIVKEKTPDQVTALFGTNIFV